MTGKSRIMAGVCLAVLLLASQLVTGCAQANTVTVTDTRTQTSTSTSTSTATITATSVMTNTVTQVSTSTSTATATVTSTSTRTSTVVVTAPADFVNKGLLVSADWLKDNLTNPNVTIIDARTAALYADGHIQGAINLLSEVTVGTDPQLTSDNSKLKNATELAGIFGSNGVSEKAKIVIYSGTADYFAARIFWALEYLGYPDVHILDGGYPKWIAAGNAGVKTATTKAAVTVTATPASGVIATKAYVLACLGNSNIVIVDSRNAADWIVKQIPGSVNILMADYLNTDGTVKSFADLTAFLATKGITPGKTIITNCYVGYRSAQAYFIFRMMGYPVSNYDGSTTEWFADASLPTKP